MKNEYIPGMCNIGPAERRMRRYSGIASLVVAILLLAIFWIYSIAPIWRVLIFIPTAGAAIGLIQDSLHFCARFGMSGLFNFSNDLRRQEGVEKAEFRRKDQHKAIIIIANSVLIGVITIIIAIAF